MKHWQVFGNNCIELTMKYRLGTDKVTLIKVSDTVPFGYTQVDKGTIAAEEKAVRDSIIAFSAELSKKQIFRLLLTRMPILYIGISKA